MTTRPATSRRDYAAVLSRLRAGASLGRERAMEALVDALWDALSPAGASWVGIYTKPAGRDELILGPRRDKPACSPLGLHGICGQCWSARRSIVVRDAGALGGDYIACDPRDRSEVAVPLLEPDGSCWGVLDIDSYEVGSFDEADAEGLARLVEGTGLSAARSQAPPVLHL